MAKRIDIGRGFAAVMSHPDPGPAVFKLAQGIVGADGVFPPCALHIPTPKEGIAPIRVPAADLQHPEKFQIWFDQNPRRCAAIQVGVPKDMKNRATHCVVLGAGEVVTFGDAFTINEARDLLNIEEDPDKLVPKGWRTKQTLVALACAIDQRAAVFSSSREESEDLGPAVPALQPPTAVTRAAALGGPFPRYDQDELSQDLSAP